MTQLHPQRLWWESTARGPPWRLLCGRSTRRSVATFRRALCARATKATMNLSGPRRRLAGWPAPTSRCAFSAVEATDKPVKIEVEIIRGHPVGALMRASRSAAMVCVGAVGYRHFQPGQVGSTAAAVAADARCPVAIIRGHDGPRRSQDRWIVVETDTSPEETILLETAIEEARLRKAPLRVVTCFTARRDVGEQRPPSDGDQRVRASLERRLARWRRRHPDLRIDSVAVNGSILYYLARNQRSVQLVVAG